MRSCTTTGAVAQSWRSTGPCAAARPSSATTWRRCSGSAGIRCSGPASSTSTARARSRPPSGRRRAERYYSYGFDYSLLRRVLLEPFRLAGSTGFVTQAFDPTRDARIIPKWITGPPDATLIVDGRFANRPELRPLWNWSAYLDGEPTDEADILYSRQGASAPLRHGGHRQHRALEAASAVPRQLLRPPSLRADECRGRVDAASPAVSERSLAPSQRTTRASERQTAMRRSTSSRPMEVPDSSTSCTSSTIAALTGAVVPAAIGLAHDRRR